MTAREVLQRLVDACVAWDGTSTIDGGEDERQEYFESRDEAVAYLAQPEAEAARSTARKLVDEQAEDDGLWFEAETAPEAYLQAALRKLHAAVEEGPSPAQPEPQDECHVPREPTEAMLRVNVENGAASRHEERVVMCSGCLLGEVWRAMYDAAIAAQEKESAK